MDITQLWDVQTLTYVLLSVVVTLIILALLSLTNRRIRLLASEVESMRRELKLIDEGVQSVAQVLQAMRASAGGLDSAGTRSMEL